MRDKFLLKTILGALGLFIFIIVGTDTYIDVFYASQKDQVAELDLLREDFGLPALDSTLLESKADVPFLPAKLSEYLCLRSELNKVESYKREKEQIESAFDTMVSDYVTEVKKFPMLDLSFLPEDVSLVPFVIKRTPELYLGQLKTILRVNIVTYNQTAQVPLRWEIDPEEEVATMSLEEKAYQLVVFGVQGQSLSETEAAFLTQYPVGGIVYLGPNISENLASFSQALQRRNSEYPLLIAVDQEGGTVKRIWWDDTLDQKSLAGMAVEAACAQFQERSALLASLGVNWNLGIVADVTANPASFIYPRVFSGSYAQAAEKVALAVRCSTPVLTTLKHYPGHGATSLDTHQGLATVAKEQASWLAEDALPFISGIAAGADTIMVGHLKLLWLDTSQPASLSQANIAYLRNNLGFSGLIVTDDLNMLRASGYSLSQIIHDALVAGNDLLLFSADNGERQTVLSEVVNNVKAGVISEADLDARVARILAAKNKVISAGDFVPVWLVY